MIASTLRAIFFGSSDYCLPILDSLMSNFKLVSVITKKDQSVEKFAKKHSIEVFTPINKNELLDLKDQLKKLNPDIFVVADYGLIIPREIIDIPKYKTLNIHFSRLPDLRGPSPVQYTILRGDKSAWISIIIMDERMDTGDIIWQKEITSFNSPHFAIHNETSKSLYEKLFKIVASELLDIINRYVNKELKPQKQDHSTATYTKHFTREDGYIPFQNFARALNWKNSKSPFKEIKDWSIMKIISSQILVINDQPPIIIDRAIRAFTPWPGIWTLIALHTHKFMTDRSDRLHLSSAGNKRPKRLKILKAHVEHTTHNLQPTTKLVLDFVQLEGKKPVSWNQFKEGHSIIGLI